MNGENDLRGFFLTLAAFEGQRDAQLVSKWRPGEVVHFTRAFRLAFKRSQFMRHWFQIRRGTSAPALGNRVAGIFIERINRHLRRFVIQDLRGNGYPDRLLLRLPSMFGCALEIKAATSWDADNWHRVVLTSASGKLRRHFKQSRVCHLLLTVFFDREGDRGRIREIRLDFLQPGTTVQARFESSLSQHILSRAKHPVRFVRGLPWRRERRDGERPMKRSQRRLRRRGSSS
jgi:hypothetical protein